MKILNQMMAIAMLAVLSACSGGGTGLFSSGQEPSVDVTMLPPMRVASFNVTVPETLTVSEENSLKPRADIVWRGDPFGPRYSQVKAIFEAGIAEGIKGVNGEVPVVLDLVVKRFHSQTEKTRYSYGGKYEIGYDLTISDARSGDAIIPTHYVYTDIGAPGGVAALAADQAGRTEKQDNINLIARSIYNQLTGKDLSLAQAPVSDPKG